MAKPYNRFPYTFVFASIGMVWVLCSETMLPFWVDVALKVLGILGIVFGVGGRLYATLFIGGMKNEGVDGKKFIDYGPYSATRNPLYFFSFVAFMGLLALQSQLSLLLIGALGFYWVYQRTIEREENFLIGKFGDSYRQYLNHVPRFFPNKSFEVPKQIFVRPEFLHKEIKRACAWLAFALLLLAWQVLQELDIVPVMFFVP